VLSQRHSPLTQITPDNVRNLERSAVFQARSLEKFEATPLVVDGVLYTVQAPNDVVAMDAVSPDALLDGAYAPSRPVARCGRVNREWGTRRHAVHGHDRRAVDRPRCQDRTAALERGRRRRRPEAGYALLLAPLVVKDKVIIAWPGRAWHSRLRGCSMPKSGKKSGASHDPRRGRAWQQDLVRRLPENGGASVWTTAA
jgi:hypothetical protein